jgi:glycosyltransferase involved in cell wall biosynthesis
MADELEAAGARVQVNDSNDGVSTPRRLGRLLRGLLRLVRARGGSVYLGGAGGELLRYQALVVALARRAGLPTVFHHHNSSYLTEHSAAMASLVRRGGAGVRHVVLGDVMARRLRERYPGATDVVVCSNAALLGPAVEPGRGARGPAGEVVLGHLSNLTLEKGLLDVVAAAERVRDAGIACRLVLAGPCVDDDVRRAVDDARRRLGAALTVTGQLDAEGVERFHGAVDLFLLPSRYRNEAEPLVVLDAMRHGVETVAFDVGCLAELVLPENLVAPDDDYAAAVLAAVQRGRADPAGPRERFERRRGDALEVRSALVAHLLGPG